MATASSVFQELEEMKAMLDAESRAESYKAPATPSPNQVPASTSPGRASASSLHATPRRKSISPGRRYVQETLQRSMDCSFSDINKSKEEAGRLDKAMEEAEEEMESAFRRAGDIHRVQIKRQENEAFELRRLLAAKDRAIDNMRDTISSTKRALDAKLAQNEAAIAQRDSEVLRLQDENKTLRRDLRALREELEKESATAAFTKESMKRRDYEASTKIAELDNIAKELGEDKSRLSSKLHAEILEKDTFQKQIQRMQVEMDAMKMERAAEKETSHMELQAWKDKHQREEEVRREYQKKYESEKAKRKLASIGKEKESFEVAELQNKLKSEKRCRKAAEKLLKAELGSREELETLFVALRDTALSKDSKRKADLDLEEIAALLRERHSVAAASQEEGRYVSPDRRAKFPASYYSPASPGISTLQHEFETSRRLLSEDNARLKHDLGEARRVLADRLSTPPRPSRLVK